MPTIDSTNGHGPKTAVLYARVSTKRQVEGYSLRQQFDKLREYAASQGYAVVAEIEAAAEANDTIDFEARPKLTKVRDMVAAGAVDVVLAQDADRIVRDPGLRAYLDEEFQAHGTEIHALDDWCDDSPEGQLLKYIKGWAAKNERKRFAERSHRNRVQRAKEGKMVPGRFAPYGYRYNKQVGTFEVDPEKAAHVRTLFRIVGAEGQPMATVKRAFKEAGVKTPGGGTLWHGSTIRRIIDHDVYRTLGYAEIAPLVPSTVAAGLDRNARYGIQWFNRSRTEKKGGKYVNHGQKDRALWVGLPVPDLGVPPEWVDAARAAVRDNVKTSNAGRRFYELAGMVHCPCGRRCNTFVNNRPTYYYICSRYQTEGPSGCPNGKYLNAAKLERRIAARVADLLSDPAPLIRGIHARIETERKKLRNPDAEIGTWMRKIEDLDARESRLLDLYADGDIPKERLRAKTAETQAERATAESELAKARNRQTHVEALERDAALVLWLYAGGVASNLEALPADERRDLYRCMRLKVVVDADGNPEVSADLIGATLPTTDEARTFAKRRVTFDRDRPEEWLERTGDRIVGCEGGDYYTVPEGIYRAYKKLTAAGGVADCGKLRTG